MKSFIAIAVVGMVLFAESPLVVQAQECEQRLNEAERQIRELEQQVARLTLPKLTGILKTRVTQYEAERICKGKGMRLPTARELAQVAQIEHGAEGISETERDGYNLVKGSDSSGNPDHFYFSYKGYKRPADDLGYWFWSSSVHPDDSDYAYSLDGLVGDVYHLYRSNVSYYDADAVRCVRSR
ncbi:MAG: hypothetical protein A2X86_14940 [Bdellovibrionales bacterium GWA2_49_15]|nr:MAG: hypothetical protein A2X86_14940 [Bdellovibrionales bacterium GWA2_49_15]HAZ13361.1 hypothetical protein [Bdellovibrionales bacterium]